MKRTVEKTNKPRRKFSEKRVKLLFFVGEAVDQIYCGRIKRKNLKVPIKSSIPVMVCMTCGISDFGEVSCTFALTDQSLNIDIPLLIHLSKR